MFWRAACAMVMVAAAGGLRAFGAPLDATTLPDDTRWVLHLDVDTGKDSGIWLNLQRRLDNLESQANARTNRGMEGLIQARTRIASLAKALEITLPGGLHDVTLYGDAYASADSCIRIHGEMSESHAEGALKNDASLKREEYNGSVILSWSNPGSDRVYAGFSGKGFAIFSSNEASVKKGIDALDGKSVLGPGSPLNPAPITTPAIGRGGPTKAMPMLWLAGTDLEDLPQKGKTESPVLKNLDAASLGAVAIGPAQGGIHVVVKGTAKTPEAAEAMQEVVVGMKALAFLAVSSDGSRRPQVINELMKPLTVTVAGQTVTGEWSVRPLPVADLELLIGLAQQEAAPAGGGRGGPAASQP